MAKADTRQKEDTKKQKRDQLRAAQHYLDQKKVESLDISTIAKQELGSGGLLKTNFASDGARMQIEKQNIFKANKSLIF